MAGILGEVASAVARNLVNDATAAPAGGDAAQQQSQDGVLKRSNHPTALLFHVGFKAGAIVMYLFGSAISSSFVFSFVIVVLLLAFDFWTVKNVSGRLLVGLRWWNEVREDGSNEWRFESREDTSRIADVDSRIFWLTLWVMPVVWGFFAVSTFFSFNYGWMLCTLVALSLSCANLYGYVKCSRAAKAKVGSFASSVATGVLQQSIASRFGGGGGAPAAGASAV
mmetsp:Transcript_56839/g.118878  ORF Transcript_56839/g.118878 Transcript_56839/m.118878 type:complete len:224 (-) Transcript_56839:24-695(-)